ncbi:D-aminoacyl-tRNA deacylase [soil metagenome]
MRALIQRVSRAEVRVASDVVGAIGPGLAVLVGVTTGDSPDTAEFLAAKTANLRVFDDTSGVMNQSALDLLHEPDSPVAIMVISQFTLYADCRKGRRPSYIRSAPPGVAMPLVDHFIEHLRSLGIDVQSGVFGAEMAVELVNDGPVTILLDSDELRRSV